MILKDERNISMDHCGMKLTVYN